MPEASTSATIPAPTTSPDGSPESARPGVAVAPDGPPKTLPPAGTRDELLAAAAAAIGARNPAIATNPWRQGFHIEPPTGLLNDPNGLCQHQGVYHLFYQWHPFAPEHRQKFWAHLTSTDLVTWREQPVALAPDTTYDSQGCYSGCAIVHEGSINLIYTGNVRGADGGRFPFQALAVVEPDGSVRKDPHNPVLGQLPGFSAHLRDPKVIDREGQYLMVLGAQDLDGYGAIALLGSQDLRTWEFLGKAAGGASDPLGYMWECPDLFALDGRDILLVSPQLDSGAPDGPARYLDLSVYAVGELDHAAGRLSHGTFQPVDAGPHFYAPQTFLDEAGRRIMIAWMGKPDQPGQPTLAEKHPTAASGWVHCLSVPRVLELRGDRLFANPVPELEALRTGTESHSEARLSSGETVGLPGVRGNRYDLEVVADLAPGARLQVQLRAGGGQATTVELAGAEGYARLDTRASGAGEVGQYRAKLTPKSTVRLRAIVDHSSVELFLNDGEATMSARIYPGPEATGVRFSAIGGPVVLAEVACHQLASPSGT